MSDERHLAEAVGRIWKMTLAFGFAGALTFWIWRGWTWSAGFVLGAAISALNFRWLKRVAMLLGSSEAKPKMAVILGLRYVILGAIAYVILKYSAISISAMFWGLFVSVAAVVGEILFELIYGTRTVGH
jgi:hypothetical protein